MLLSNFIVIFFFFLETVNVLDGQLLFGTYDY